MANQTSGQTTARESDRPVLEELEREWSAAVVRGDPRPLEQILSEDCTLTGPDGSVLTKSLAIDGVFQEKAAFTNKFTQRRGCADAYSGLTNAQFVSALMTHYGLGWTT